VVYPAVTRNQTSIGLCNKERVCGLS
jgi:hypothetical protein